MNKYLLYAIGEIFLVVFGILIALQINDWNEVRKQNQKTNELNQALMDDFKSNEILLNEKLIFTKNAIHRLEIFSKFLQSPRQRCP